MMGMSSTEWSRYMHDALGVPLEPEAISAEVARRVQAIYRESLPLIDGAREAVERLAARWPLAVASSSNRELIELVLELSGMAKHFAATVSSEEVPHGKPAPSGTRNSPGSTCSSLPSRSSRSATARSTA